MENGVKEYRFSCGNGTPLLSEDSYIHNGIIRPMAEHLAKRHEDRERSFATGPLFISGRMIENRLFKSRKGVKYILKK